MEARKAVGERWRAGGWSSLWELERVQIITWNVPSELVFWSLVAERAEESAQIAEEEWKKCEKARNGGGSGKSGSWRIAEECRGRSSSARKTSPSRYLEGERRKGFLAGEQPPLEVILKGRGAGVWAGSALQR